MIEWQATIEAALAFVARYYNPGVRVYWLFLLTAIVLALYAYLRQGGSSPSFRGFVAFLLPRSVWLSKSSLVDYRFFLIVVPAWSAVVAPALLSTSQVGAWLSGLPALESSGFARTADPLRVGVFYTVALFFADDFRRYIVHYLFHRLRFLWEFHKVHHSAETLNPLTVYREHPVYLLVSAIAAAAIVGGITGLFLGLFGESLDIWTVLGINVGYFFFDMLGSNLRHSHIWLSWGPRLEHIFISPAQHQVHHSDQPRHFDKNFGSALAIWDWMFGTLYVPAGREDLRFGLPTEPGRWYDSVTGLLLKPFGNAFRTLSRTRNGKALSMQGINEE